MQQFRFVSPLFIIIFASRMPAIRTSVSVRGPDRSSFSSGGVLARLNLSIEECRGLIGEAKQK